MRRPAIYQPHPYLLYELTPRYVSRDGLTHHNSYGFRGPEFPLEKPAGTYRIVCMGESSTYGTGIRADEATYPARLGAHLRQASPHRTIEVLNAGVGGYTSAESLLQFIFKVQPIEPDLVLYYYTHNDVHPRRFPTLSRDYREYSKSWYEPPRASGWRRLRQALIRWVSPGSASIGELVRRYAEYEGRRQASNVLRNPPDYFQANLSCLAMLARGWGSEVLFVNPPYRGLVGARGMEPVNPVVQGVQEHRRIVEGLGREFGCRVFDLLPRMPYPATREELAQPGSLYRDWVHVSERGADLMGWLIAGEVASSGCLGPAVPAAPDRVAAGAS
jgi:hypothetical protein